MVDDRQEGDDVEKERMEYGWSIIGDAQVCLEKGSSLSSVSKKGIVCVSTAKPRDIVFEGIEYAIGAEDSIVVIVGDGEYQSGADENSDGRMTVVIKVPKGVNVDEFHRLETWARLSVGDRFHLIVADSENVGNKENESAVVIPLHGTVERSDDASPKSEVESSEHATSSDEEWPSSDEIAARILENSDWATQCIQSGAGHLRDMMQGFTDYTVPEEPSPRESDSISDSNDDARAVFEGLKSASEAVASAANSAVGTVGGYLVRAGTAALQGLREEMKDDKNFVAADKVGSAAVTGVARVFSGLNSAKTELQGAAADEVAKAAARKYGKDAGVMLRSSIATAGNAMSLLSVATPSNVVSQGVKKSSTPTSTMADSDTEKVEEADLLGLESSEDEKSKQLSDDKAKEDNALNKGDDKGKEDKALDKGDDKGKEDKALDKGDDKAKEDKALDKGDDKAEEDKALDKGDDKAKEDKALDKGDDKAEEDNALNKGDAAGKPEPSVNQTADSMDSPCKAAKTIMPRCQETHTNTHSATSEVESNYSGIDNAPSTPSTEAEGDTSIRAETAGPAEHLASLPPPSVV